MKEDTESLKNNIIRLVQKIESTVYRNSDFFDQEIMAYIVKIKEIYVNNNCENELNQNIDDFKSFKENINLIISFGNKIKETVVDGTVSLQYLHLLNSEIQNLSFYFNTDNIYSYLKQNISQLNNISIDYQVLNGVFSFLQQFFNDTKKFNRIYIQKIAQLKAFELVKDTGTNENVVIIGANGSGKSSFSRNIQHILGKSIVIISAQKILQYKKSDRIYITDTKINEVYSFQQSEKLCKDTNFANVLENDMNSLIEALITEYIQYTTEFYQKRNLNKEGKIEGTILEKVFSLWHEIIPHRELFYTPKDGLKVKGSNCNNYDFIYLSDGEKAVFYYAAHILLAKQNSYIIIDEPENHLNFSVVNRMWNILEKARQDCVFMYLTHNINFASSRVNSRKLWMKSYDQENYTWNVIKLPNNDNLPESLYMELLGSRSKILFCEGDDNSSLDYKLYSLLFPEYTVKPVKGHYDVIQSVRAFNKSTQIHGNKAIGIIDRDYHSIEEIEAWKKDEIYSLSVCEIENIFLDEKLIDEAIKHFYCQNSLQSVKNQLFTHIQKTIEMQSTIYARDKVKSILSGLLIKEKKDIKKLTEEVNEISEKIDCLKIYKEKKEELEHIVSAIDYEKLIIESNDKSLCAELNKLIVNDYKEKMILMLRDNDELRMYIKDKYFEEIE